MPESAPANHVREALSRLESDGPVERVAGLQGYRLTRMDATQIADQGALRRALESEACRLCAAKASDGELDFIADPASRCDAALMSGKLCVERLNQLDLDFHRAIMAGAHCPPINVRYILKQGNQAGTKRRSCFFQQQPRNHSHAHRRQN